MTPTLLLAILLLGPAKERTAPPPQPSLAKSLMTREEFVDAGLGKLSQRELAALDAWLRQHVRAEPQRASRPASRRPGAPAVPVRDARAAAASAALAEDCVPMTGSADLPGMQMDLDLAGSFGEQRLAASGGRLSVDLCLSRTGARYERIEATSTKFSRSLTGDFSPGFGKGTVAVELQLDFTVTLLTAAPSETLALSPLDGGIHQIERFSPRRCATSCVAARFVGTWSLSGPDGTSSGPIDATFDGIGVHAMATANVDGSGFPGSATLRDFTWTGGTFDLPELVSVHVAGAPLRVHPQRTMLRVTETTLPLASRQ